MVDFVRSSTCCDSLFFLSSVRGCRRCLRFAAMWSGPSSSSRMSSSTSFGSGSSSCTPWPFARPAERTTLRSMWLFVLRPPVSERHSFLAAGSIIPIQPYFCTAPRRGPCFSTTSRPRSRQQSRGDGCRFGLASARAFLAARRRLANRRCSRTRVEPFHRQRSGGERETRRGRDFLLDRGAQARSDAAVPGRRRGRLRCQPQRTAFARGVSPAHGAGTARLCRTGARHRCFGVDAHFPGSWYMRAGGPPENSLGGSLTPALQTLAGLFLTRHPTITLLATLLLWLVWSLRRATRSQDPKRWPLETLVVLGGLIFVMPQVLPWAFLLVGTLAPYSENRGWLLFTATAPVTYLAFGDGAFGFWLGFTQYFAAYAVLIFFGLGRPPREAAGDGPTRRPRAPKR